MDLTVEEQSIIKLLRSKHGHVRITIEKKPEMNKQESIYRVVVEESILTADLIKKT